MKRHGVVNGRVFIFIHECPDTKVNLPNEHAQH